MFSLEAVITEPTIVCPECKAEIKLNESLAAPLIESTRQHAGLAWTHYRALLKVVRREALDFYDIEAIRHAWSAISAHSSAMIVV